MTDPAGTWRGEGIELVVFDVDGTLQDTFAWWPRVIRAGLARFAELQGFAADLPDDAAACAVVGLRDEGVWGPFLPEEHRHRWRELRDLVVPLEVAELHAGRDYLFAGVRALLTHLRRIGVRVALASNCRSRYFGALCQGQGLAALSDWQFCLDSNGGCAKTDMVRFALEAAGTRRAVMVGDRDTDQIAARAAGIPFVWRVNERFPLDGADGHWHGEPDDLLGVLGLPAICSAGGE
jgi:adenosylhomocysteine nucleosidase